MGRSGSRLKTVESTVNALVQSAAWKGTDGDRFRNEWASSLRPLLNRTSEALQGQASSLLKHADEQAQASAASSGTGSPHVRSGSGGSTGTGSGAGSSPERNWGDAFTDPDYQHAPSGIEWLLEKFGFKDGNDGSDIATAMVFVADKFNWTLDLGQVEKGLSKFFDFMRPVGKGLGVLGGAIGALDIASGIEGRDAFRFADGVIGGGLSVAAAFATGTIVGAPAGLVLGALRLAGDCWE